MSNIEDDIEILESIVKVHNDFLQGVNKESINEKEIRALEHLLSDYKNMKFNYENLIHDISLIAESLDMQEDSTIEEIALRISEEMYNKQQINEEHKKINGELRERVKELEEKNEHLSNTSDYETISLECVHLEEQLEIVNSRVQELEEESRKKSIELICYEEELENSIPKQIVRDKINEINKAYEDSKDENGESSYYYPDFIIRILQRFLGGDENSGNIKS